MRIFAITLCLLLAARLSMYAQAPLKPRDPSITGPQTFAIILGISKYKFVRPLAYADKDAMLFKQFLQSPGGGSVKEENIFSLLNEKATSSSFWSKSFQWLKAKKPAKGDKLFIYLAGHGDAIDEEQFFFLTYDCNPMGDKNNYLAGGSIQLYNLKRKIAAETAKGVEVVFVMDACRTSELPGGQEGQSFLTNAITEQKMGEIMMLATAAGQVSLEDKSIGNGHGLFTYYLVDGLSGLADNEGTADNEVTYNEIKKYIDKNVPSVAMQQFKKKQEPYFCCNEFSERIISKVDAAYLKKWQQEKKRGGGNSFTGNLAYDTWNAPADTLLTETYNRFTRAIETNKLTGAGSAEDFYNQLQKKFPGNPYTEDARTTLAGQFIDFAQAKINDYLSCLESSPKQRQENFEAGLRLQKAIDLLKNDEPEYAKELSDQMHLLKAAGDFGTSGVNGTIDNAFKEAYQAIAIQPNGAYIQNWLAILHLENNRLDSAKYYAEKATKTAPNWRCAFVTLAKLQREPANNNQPEQPKKPAAKTPGRKFQFGSVLGAGQIKYAISTTSNPQIDTLTGATATGKIKYDLGVIGQINLGGLISIRPAVLVSVESSELVYTRRSPTGAPVQTVTVPVKTTSVNIPVPIIIRFSNKNIAPYISAGPVLSFIRQKDDENSARVAVNTTDVLGDAGIGVDIGFLKSHLVISPEIKYTRGFTDANGTSNTSFNRIITKLNKEAFTFSIYVRAR